MARDPDDLERFVDAQQPHYDTALAELRTGLKRTHWMWFIFPQLRGLGSSSLSRYFGIANLDEAKRYLAHPLLGSRLRECTEAVTRSHAESLQTLFGTPDDLKFHSSMTLFAAASGGQTGVSGDAFEAALERWFAGDPDGRTIELLRAESA